MSELPQKKMSYLSCTSKHDTFYKKKLKKRRNSGLLVLKGNGERVIVDIFDKALQDRHKEMTEIKSHTYLFSGGHGRDLLRRLVV